MSRPATNYDWWSLLLAGFARPLEYWPRVQFALALGLAGLCAGGIGMWLCAATDVSGHEARMQALAELEAKLEHARLRVAGLPAQRQRSHALGAASAPDRVPDNEALLKLVSRAVDQSRVGLDVFEPGTPVQSNGIEEILLHVRVQGAYVQLADFMGALARLPQPILPVEIRIRRGATGGLSLDADLRVLAASSLKPAMVRLPDLNVGRLSDPFERSRNEALAHDNHIDSSSELADDSIVGTLQADGKRAVLVQTGAGWQLFALAASQSNADGAVR
jgi:Tfp pilus assembly protein PilO